ERGEEARKRAARGARQLIARHQLARRLDEGDPFAARPDVEQLHRRRADAAARQVDDALKGEIVARLADEPQIGEGVADLLALVEARAADDAVGQRQRDKALLELAGLEAGAQQDRDLAQRMFLALQRLDLVADPARFLFGVPQPADDDALALLGAGPQRLAEAALVVGDDAGGDGEDFRGRAVILLEPDDQRAGKIRFEFQDVAD